MRQRTEIENGSSAHVVAIANQFISKVRRELIALGAFHPISYLSFWYIRFATGTITTIPSYAATTTDSLDKVS